MTKWQLALRLVGVGWFVAFSEILGALAGWWLDNKLNTKPIFSLVGVTTGTFIALFGVYRLLRPTMNYKQGNNKKDKEKGWCPN